jgi:hypothetical protein
VPNRYDGKIYAKIVGTYVTKSGSGELVGEYLELLRCSFMPKYRCSVSHHIPFSVFLRHVTDLVEVPKLVTTLRIVIAYLYTLENRTTEDCFCSILNLSLTGMPVHGDNDYNNHNAEKSRFHRSIHRQPWDVDPPNYNSNARRIWYF